jgi:hypothetical protein
MAARNTELARAIAFEERLRDQSAERLVPFRFGTGVFNDTFPDVWTLNVLRVERPQTRSAADLAGEAERLHGGAGQRHRRIGVPDDAEGERLAEGFAALGWESERVVSIPTGARRRSRTSSPTPTTAGAATRAPSSCTPSPKRNAPAMTSSSLSPTTRTGRRSCTRASGSPRSAARGSSSGNPLRVTGPELTRGAGAHRPATGAR